MMIAVLAAVLATVIGTTSALAMNKLNFKGKSIFMSIMTATMVVPVVVAGAALYTTFVSGANTKTLTIGLISCNGARTMNLGDRYLLREGNPASFIVIDADSDFDALRNRAEVLTSVRNGKVLFRKKPTEFAEEMLTDKGI